MTGKNLDLMRRIFDRALNATWKHCFLHREALAAKGKVPVLHETLKDVIQVVNYIKWSAENTQCFQNWCQDLGSEHAQVIVSCRGSLAFNGKDAVPFLWTKR